MAIACLRLFTLRPLPDLSVPFLRRCIALLTRFDAALPYRRLPEDFFLAIQPSVAEVNDLIRVAHLVPKNSGVNDAATLPELRT